MSSINLRTLAELREQGAPQFFEQDALVLRERFKAKYEEFTGKTLFEGQPEMFMIETLAYAFATDNGGKQFSAEQNTVVWSEGQHLEAVGANVSIFKLLAQPARTTLEFFREQALPFDAVIPKGTIIEGGGVQFSSDADVVIAPGALKAQITATALTPGTLGNGIAAFTINTPVGELPEGIQAHNLSETNGGSNVEDQERFRERAANGNFLISRGGTRPGYRELIKGLHPDIVDVNPVKPEPGFIELYVLMASGVLTDEVKALIEDFLDPEEHYPMGDYPSLPDPTARVFDFTLIVRLDVADATMEARAGAVARSVFANWTQTLGLRMAPSSITNEVRKLSANVIDAEVVGLPFTDLGDKEFPVLGDLTVDVQVRPNV